MVAVRSPSGLLLTPTARGATAAAIYSTRKKADISAPRRSAGATLSSRALRAEVGEALANAGDDYA